MVEKNGESTPRISLGGWGGIPPTQMAFFQQSLGSFVAKMHRPESTRARHGRDIPPRRHQAHGPPDIATDTACFCEIQKSHLRNTILILVEIPTNNSAPWLQSGAGGHPSTVCVSHGSFSPSWGLLNSHFAPYLQILQYV